MTQPVQPEALRIADQLETDLLAIANGEMKVGKLSLEFLVRGYEMLRRLHAENVELHDLLMVAGEVELGLRGDLIEEAQRTAEQKLRADQMTEQHRMQAAMNSEARAELAQLRESRKPLPVDFKGTDGINARLHYRRGWNAAQAAHGIGEKTP